MSPCRCCIVCRMNPQGIFLFVSAAVLVSLLMSSICWYLMSRRAKGIARTSAMLFVIAFGLYFVGQLMAFLQGVGMLRGGWAVPSLLYAIAAVLFAFGSYYQYVVHGKK